MKCSWLNTCKSIKWIWVVECLLWLQSLRNNPEMLFSATLSAPVTCLRQTRPPFIFNLNLIQFCHLKLAWEFLVPSELLSEWKHRWSFYCNSIKRIQVEMVDEEIFTGNTKGFIYGHLAGYYMRYIVVICTICSNGGEVLILCILEIEMFTVLVQFNRRMCAGLLLQPS